MPLVGLLRGVFGLLLESCSVASGACEGECLMSLIVHEHYAPSVGDELLLSGAVPRVARVIEGREVAGAKCPSTSTLRGCGALLARGFDGVALLSCDRSAEELMGVVPRLSPCTRYHHEARLGSASSPELSRLNSVKREG